LLLAGEGGEVVEDELSVEYLKVFRILKAR
jgi:hypothetical protein